MLPLTMLGPLMLMFLLRDADSTCPDELNPLILDIPEIIGEYGDIMLINCSSTVEDHDGIYWRLENTTSTHNSDIEDEKTFILWALPLSDWNLTAECKIRLNDSHECSKNLDITIYRNPEEVAMFPIKHVNSVVEGTPYELQCDIIHVAPVQNLTVRWYKDNQTIMTDSFTSNPTKTPTTVSSTLTVNISRGESGAQFRCDAQLDFGPDGPQTPVISSDTHKVSVHYAPELKNKTYTDFVIVDEGDNVALNCEAEGMPPPVFHWTCDEVNISEDANNLNITRVNTTAIYTCTATNYLGNVTKEILVRVIHTIKLAAPAAMTTPAASTPRGCPLILTPAELVVRFGDPASVNCSTSETDAAGMGWEAEIGGTGFEKPPVVTWTVEKLKVWTIKPTCYLNLIDESQCTVILAITVYKTPDAVSVSASDPGPMVEGTEHQLNCDIISVAPAQKLKVKWYRGNETVHMQTINITSVDPVNVSSPLSVIPERDYNGALFRCEAELHLGPKGPDLLPTATSLPYTAVVHYKPLILACPGHYAGMEHEFNLDMLPCQTDGNPPPAVQWYYQGRAISASEPLNRNHSGKYTAEFVNTLGRSSASVDITVEYSPSFTCNDRYEVQEDGELQAKCEPEGMPKPTITWFKDGKAMATPQRWTKHDSGEYSLTATNKHGTANHVLHLDVLYAPVFKEGGYSKEVTPGENVTLDCRAEGNPRPVIHWNYTAAVNVMATPGGRHTTVSVTGATSTNAGVYICVATNKVGSVTRSVTLKMKGEPHAGHSALIWGLTIALIIFVLLIFIIITRKLWTSHGQYTFVPHTANGSDGPIPMSNRVQA